MAIAFQSPDPDHYNAVEVTDIELKTNELLPSTINFEREDAHDDQSSKNRKAQLKVADELFGPLKIGSFLVTRRALDALGTTSTGQPLNGKNTFFSHPKKSFINSLQFDPLHIEARMQSTGVADDYALPSLLFEIASQRPVTAPPLLKAANVTASDPNQYRHKMDKLLKSAQKLDVLHAHLSTSTPHWVNRVKSSSMISMGAGLQAFGIYSGLRGLQDAIRRKDEGEVVFNSLSISAEITSLAVELAVTKQAKYMIDAGQKAYKDFAKTLVGVRLGRAAGLIASALTLPFDIISAVKSFDSAARASGKEAMDHYVNAGLSVASAAMTLILGTAALAGFSFIGPAGLAAGLLLVAGSQIYAAVRVVDDIDDYIELTAHERLRAGWFAFWGISPDQSVQDRYEITKATVEHAKLLQTTSRKLLDGKLKESTEVIVNGSFQVELKPTQTRHFDWDAQQYSYKTVAKPQIVDGNDMIDASAGISANMPGAEFGTPGENKGALWFIGGGNDTILGVKKKPNRFYYGAGIKELTGGEKDDEFIFEGAADVLKNGLQSSLATKLEGGSGNDTLVLDGHHSIPDKQRLGYHIDLNAGQLSIIHYDNTNERIRNDRHTWLDSIESVETLAGAANKVIGTDGPNIIKSRGFDTIQAGNGDDQIYMFNNHGSVSGGAGEDQYAVAHKSGGIFITEDGVDESVIALDWRMDLIKSWKIENQQLVITSGFDLDDIRERDVYIKGVYQEVGSLQKLRNKKLTFITKDGFHLTPDLPETIENLDPTDIQVVITRQGALQNPIILTQPECTVRHDKNSSYYISKINEQTTFHVKQTSRGALTTLHLDYASHELTGMEAYYHADLRRERTFDRIIYTDCGLTFHFDSKRLIIKNLASSFIGGQHRITDRITRPINSLNHHFVLIMNDGISYRVSQPALPDTVFVNDQFEISGPMKWTCEVPLPLRARVGKYLHRQPFDNEAHKLGATDKCVQIYASPEHAAIENLTGEGSKYLVHLSHGVSLRIATPGALADATPRLAFASDWEFDATQLGRVTINLTNNHLVLGHTVIHLPDYKSPADLIDNVSVITAGGIIYTVDLVFETVQIESLDGRYCKDYSDLNNPIPEELVLNEIKELPVLNIAMKDGTTGALSFSLSTRRWTLDTDKSRTIHYADLKRVNRCQHQLEHCHALMEHGADASPPVSAANLRTLLDACKAL
ncbi:calcium-binding protein [Pseudomonas sp.]|uniref:calcium-binding protein n=1 Tax=Pseudomonas sp. TaxID=306 RepID=UPI003F2BE465